MTDPGFTRRDILKVGAGLAALSLSGCGGGGGGGTSGASTTTIPTLVSSSSSTTGEITRLAIHPTIGIARVGNSPTDFFLGQEVPGPLAEPPGGFKDSAGALKRQAARFRIYGFDAAGNVVREITPADGAIQWTVHLANKKAAWYRFETALDVPIAQPTSRRNPTYVGAQRDGLVIDGGPRTISGTDASGVRFDSGNFLGTNVYLGELRTDDAGRLIVLGGRGHSFSPLGLPLTATDNAGWCDDISDGPVRARVTVNGQLMEADPAWVVVAPPNYGPAFSEGYVTLYEVIYNTMLATGFVTRHSSVRFLRDIYPLFARMVDMQWANAGVLRDNGPGTSMDFLSPSVLPMLGSASPQYASYRASIFNMFRNPDFLTMQPSSLPPVYGDEVTTPATSPRNWLAVTTAQYADLQAWSKGLFQADGLTPMTPSSIDAVPISEQPQTLDQASLGTCLGEAFHPGCEATWPLRIPRMYSSPFRLRARPEGEIEPDYGDVLTPEAALGPQGPLNASGPGSLTRWMAVPWQTDTALCGSGSENDPYLWTFWPARVPNQILTADDYATVMDTTRSTETRLAAFHNRTRWLRNILNTDVSASLARMVDQWPLLGLVMERPGPPDLPSLPRTFKVEIGNGTTPLNARDPGWKIFIPPAASP